MEMAFMVLLFATAGPISHSTCSVHEVHEVHGGLLHVEDDAVDLGEDVVVENLQDDGDDEQTVVMRAP